MRRPAWAAAPSFSRCWAAIESVRYAGSEGHPRSYLDWMARSRVIAVERAQVTALPVAVDWADPVQVERHPGTLGVLADALRPPFRSIFIDLDGAPIDSAATPRALGVLVNCPDAENRFVACAFAQADKGAVLPLGLAILPPARGFDNSLRYAPLAWQEGLEPDEINELAMANVRALDLALAVLGWLESVNVDLAEATLSRKQRARELKKGRQVALTVQVRRPRRRPAPSWDGPKANYSHRFEVRGHYMHFAKGPIFDATPPEKRSFVPGIGECRKVWCPPHVKGPLDRPLVPKVRVVEMATDRGGSE